MYVQKVTDLFNNVVKLSLSIDVSPRPPCEAFPC